VSHELPFLGIYKHTVELSRSYYATEDPRRTVPLLSSSAEATALDLKQATTKSEFVTLNLHDTQQPSTDAAMTQLTGAVHAMLKQSAKHDSNMFRLRHDLNELFVPKDLQLNVSISVVYSLPDPVLKIYASTTYISSVPQGPTLWLDFELLRWSRSVKAKPLTFVPTSEQDVRILGYMVANALSSPNARECLRILLNNVNLDYDQKVPRPGTGRSCETCNNQLNCLALSTA